MLARSLLLLALPAGMLAQQVIHGEANLLHRAPLPYPAEALQKNVQGIVLVDATLNERGVVIDARVISGPELLRKAALKSILDWHYSPGTLSPVQVVVDFKTPQPRPVLLNGVSSTGARQGTPTPPRPVRTALEFPNVPEPPKLTAGVIKRIQFTGVSSQTQETLLSRIPVREGDSFEIGTISRIIEILLEVDEHLAARYDLLDFDGDRRQFALRISYVSRDADSAAK